MNLNEFVEQTYLEFLKEQENKEYIAIQEDYMKLLERVSSMVEWINFEAELSNLNEDLNIAELTKEAEGLKTLFDTLGTTFGYKKPGTMYEPAPDMTLKPRAGSNVMAFLSTLIEWLKNIVARVFNWFRKVLSTITGLEYHEKDPGELSFTKLMQKAKDAQANDKAFNSFGGTGWVDLSSKSIRNVLGVEDDKIKNVIFDQINHESQSLTEKRIYDEDDKETVVNKVQVTYLDPSKDLSALREALNHFFKLFDESVGSSGEKLFETGDLEILFKSFQAVQKSLMNGDTAAYTDVGGRLTKLQIVSPERLRDNLIRTKINTDKLSNAYKDTQRIISNILQVLAQKNYQGAVIAPATFKALSSASFKQMAEIVKVLDNRMKSTKVLEKNMSKMEEKYTALVRELEKLRGQYMQLGSNYYAPSILQKEISDLFVAGKYVTQTIMLRFSTLMLYTKTLRETKEAIYNLNLINKRKGLFMREAEELGVNDAPEAIEPGTPEAVAATATETDYHPEETEADDVKEVVVETATPKLPKTGLKSLVKNSIVKDTDSKC